MVLVQFPDIQTYSVPQFYCWTGATKMKALNPTKNYKSIQNHLRHPRQHRHSIQPSHTQACGLHKKRHSSKISLDCPQLLQIPYESDLPAASTSDLKSVIENNYTGSSACVTLTCAYYGKMSYCRSMCVSVFTTLACPSVALMTSWSH